MNSINRFNPVAVATSVNIHGVRMQACDDGRWVSYDMHKQEIESLQARLKALESTQKHQISAYSIIADHVEQAIKEAVGKLVHEACEQLLKDLPKYNGDPCHSTVDAFVNELATGPGKTVKNDTYSVADELTKNGKFTFGSNFGEGKALTMSTAKMEPRSGGYGYVNRNVWAVGECESARDRKVAVCYHVNGNAFINGCQYDYEVDECEPGCEPRLIHIAQDAFISDLKGDYRWKAKRIGKVMNANATLGDAYAIVNPDGGVVAQFYIK
ncbi:hypothetical protein CJ19_049 [Escherichia phage CJ19]|nr:hypothetical protein CJ19_049 [Escherichia phage CJ19]